MELRQLVIQLGKKNGLIASSFHKQGLSWWTFTWNLWKPVVLILCEDGDQPGKQHAKICFDLPHFIKSCAKYYTNAETCPSVLLEGSPPVWWWELLCTMILKVIVWYKEVWDKASCYMKCGKCFIFVCFLPPHRRLCYSTTADNSSYAVLIGFVK